MELDRLQLLFISILAALCKEYQTSEPQEHSLVRKGLFDSIFGPNDAQPLAAFTDGAQNVAAITNGAQPSAGFLDSVSGWFSASPSPEELARQKAAALKAEQERARAERKRRNVESIRVSLLRIPGVGLADSITRKATSAIGLGLGLGAGKAQTLINDVYNNLRGGGE